MADLKYWYSCSHEQFRPSELLQQASAAEAAGFDGLGCSDHFAPWFPEGQSGQAWAWLGAAGAQTELPIGTGVTALVHRYHPAVVAQAFMTLEELYPGRIYLGVGSGEALNEIACGAEPWPSAGEQIDRMAAALEVILALWDGKTVTTDAGWFAVKEAKLYTRAAQRPKLYVSAFGPKAAKVAGQYGDGVWTLGDPEAAPEVIEAYKASCEEHGRPVGEIIVHSGIAWAKDADALREGAIGWRGAQPDEVYTDAIGTPEQIQATADRDGIGYDELREGFIVSPDPEEHIAKVKQMKELGATVICLQGVSGADPMGTIDLYRETVLPALRGTRV